MNTALVDYSKMDIYTRHGGAYDRGGADSYYGRPRAPHYYTERSMGSPRVEMADMTFAEIAAYNQGFDDNEASGYHKEWT